VKPEETQDVTEDDRLDKVDFEINLDEADIKASNDMGSGKNVEVESDDFEDGNSSVKTDVTTPSQASTSS